MFLRMASRIIMISLLWLPTAGWSDVHVIVNAGNSTGNLSADQVERIFLLKTKRFDNGDSAEPVNQPEGSKARNRFNSQVLKRNEQQLKYYWSRKMFSGSDKPPPALVNDAEVEAFVAGKPGGVGYVLEPPKDARVKVVLTIKD